MRIVVGPVDRGLWGALRSVSTSEMAFFATLEREAFWADSMAEPLLDDSEVLWLASRSTLSLAVSSLPSLERALRLMRADETIGIDIEIHAAVAELALREARLFSNRVRLVGFDIDVEYYPLKEWIRRWCEMGKVDELVLSVFTETTGDPIDALLAQDVDAIGGPVHTTIADVRAEVTAATVPVLVSIRSPLRRACRFVAEEVPEAAGVFLGISRVADDGGRFPARVTYDELARSDRD